MHRTVLEYVAYPWKPGVKFVVDFFEHLNMMFSELEETACTSLSLLKRLLCGFFFAVCNFRCHDLETCGGVRSVRLKQIPVYKQSGFHCE